MCPNLPRKVRRSQSSWAPEQCNQSQFSLIAVSFSEFANQGCFWFYLDKSSKINSNCPERSPRTTQGVQIKKNMDPG